ncbi:MAG: hypothetical protein AVDCRST_MAG79-2772, partial [uncultured Thermoleophilia bacterium]
GIHGDRALHGRGGRRRGRPGRPRGGRGRAGGRLPGPPDRDADADRGRPLRPRPDLAVARRGGRRRRARTVAAGVCGLVRPARGAEPRARRDPRHPCRREL